MQILIYASILIFHFYLTSSPIQINNCNYFLKPTPQDLVVTLVVFELSFLRLRWVWGVHNVFWNFFWSVPYVVEIKTLGLIFNNIFHNKKYL